MSSPKNHDHDIAALQNLVAEHAQMIQDLSHELFRQQNDILQLKDHLSRLQKDLEMSKDHQSTLNNDVLKPPHY